MTESKIGGLKLKEHFADNTGKLLIEQYGYKIADTSSMAASIIKYSLYNENKKRLTVVSFIDSDILDFKQSGIIGEMLQKELNAFKEVFNRDHIVYYKVFVTDFGLYEDNIGHIIKLYNVAECSAIIPVVVDLNNNCIIMPDKTNRDCIYFQEILTQSLESDDDQDTLYNLEQVAENAARNESAKRKPYATYSIIAINIIIFILTSLAGGMSNPAVLVLFGAKINSLVARGQYWRLITSAFLHANLAHIAFNMYGLYGIGSLIENVYGSKKFLIIYMVSAVYGSVMSFAFSPYPSVGASGAIFGLFGATLYLCQRNPRMFKTSFGVNIIVVLAFNIIYGFSNSGIDNFAHLGGLLGGYLCANITGYERSYNIAPKKIVLLIFTAVFLILLFAIGMSSALSLY